MPLDLNQFFRTNKKVVIWASFFGLLFLVRKVFVLVFLTFILCYIFNNAISHLERRTPLGRRFWTIVFYSFFVVAIGGLFFTGVPIIVSETKTFFTQLPKSIDGFYVYLDQIARKQPHLAPFFDGFKETISFKNLLGIKSEALVGFVVTFFNHITHFFTYLLLATIFSFLILFDFPNLRRRFLALRETRFHEAYDETADSVAKFAIVVGYTFQAQILIAIINTLLTTAGLWFLNIEPIIFLAIIVFFAGLIPVWGTFISSVPIFLLASNSGGLPLALKVLLMIVIVHGVEAYILNPNIISAVLRINPLITLIILYVGHALFGLWGVLLGVPVAVYVYRYILMKPVEENE